MSDTTHEAGGQVVGPEDGAMDNAAENAAPEVRDEVLGRHSHDGVSDADRSVERDVGSRAPGDTTQPRTGAETPFDAEDLVHARGQDVTEATLRLAEEDIEAEGPHAIEHEVDSLDR
jgi:hypothetical protein